MKFFKWKIFIITSFVCLLPILFGVFMWDRLPETMAIHFNFYGEPDNFASKGFVVFALPFLMLFAQAVCCFSVDLDSHKHGGVKKMKWW